MLKIYSLIDRQYLLFCRQQHSSNHDRVHLESIRQFKQFYYEKISSCKKKNPSFSFILPVDVRRRADGSLAKGLLLPKLFCLLMNIFLLLRPIPSSCNNISILQIHYFPKLTLHRKQNIIKFMMNVLFHSSCLNKYLYF